jgi:hypothetical protein
MIYHNVITHISWLKLCQDSLKNTVALWEDHQPHHQHIKNKILIKLLRLHNDKQIFYQSAIALALSNYYELQSKNIAQQLILIGFQHHQQFKVKVTTSGMIEFYPQDHLLADYLITLPQHSYLARFSEVITNLNQEENIAFQYLYNRCGQLLNLGHETKLIQLVNPQEETTFYQWQKPQFLPLMQQDQLIFNHPAEIELIEKLIMIIDLLDQPQKFNLSKVGRSLGTSFLNFERKCQIWGDVAKYHQKLSQARLGLIAITQFLLQLMFHLTSEI